jgi:hypothetical protein
MTSGINIHNIKEQSILQYLSQLKNFGLEYCAVLEYEDNEYKYPI